MFKRSLLADPATNKKMKYHEPEKLNFSLHPSRPNRAVFNKTASHPVEETPHIRDILSKCSYNSWVLFDLDNTVFESTQELGGNQWFIALCEYAKTAIQDSIEANECAIELYHTVQKYTNVQVVEQNTAHILKILHDLNIPVIAITARSKEIIEPTLRQLKSIGIDFSVNWKSLPKFHAFIADDDRVIYHEGIIFCSGKGKDTCFTKFADFLKERHDLAYADHVVLIDDTAKHVQAVGKAVTAKNSDYTGLRYSQLDEKVKQFEMCKAHSQLREMSRLFFTKEEKQVLNKLHLDTLAENHDNDNVSPASRS